MKRLQKFLLLNMVCVAVFFLSSCYQFEERVNGLEIYSSQFHGDAFAAYYYWDLNSEQMDIVIPDTYRNYPVRHIGGYFGRGVPAGFTVVWDVSEADSYDHIFYCSQQVLHNSANNSDKADQYKNAEIQYYDFVLHIGANIDDEDIYTNVKDFLVCESFAEIPSVKITVTRFYIECAENNRVFFSREGKLYLKSTGELIEDFFYSDFNLQL